VHNYFFWIGLIVMFVFWVFVQFGQELNLKNFEHEMVEDLSRELVVCRGMCVDFFCVIEEEVLQLHFDKCGLGCFCCLGFGLFTD